jgi:hypothetical protein
MASEKTISITQDDCVPPQHRTITLQYQGQPVEIDVELILLLALLWKHGIHTRDSCQGGLNPRSQQTEDAYITFRSREDLMRAMKLSSGLSQYVTIHVTGEDLVPVFPGGVGVPEYYLGGNWSMRWASEHTPAVEIMVARIPLPVGSTPTVALPVSMLPSLTASCSE